jgi:hypothetical protein
VECARKNLAALLSWNFREYTEVVAEYAKRKLTFEFDTPNAFAGIRRVFENCMGAGLLYGLPTSYFDAALLWMPEGGLEHRDLEWKDALPSWSWMGWRGAIQYTALRGWEILVHPLIRWYHGDQDVGGFRLLNEFGIGMRTACHPPGKLIKFWKNNRWDRDCLYTHSPSPDFASSDPDAEIKALGSEVKLDLFLRFQTTSARFSLDETLIIQPYDLQPDEGLEEDDMFINSLRPKTPCRRILDSEGKAVGYVVLNAPLSGNANVEMIVVAATPGNGNPLDQYAGYAIMLIRREAGVAIRLGIGEIDQDAWWNAEPAWVDVTLG